MPHFTEGLSSLDGASFGNRHSEMANNFVLYSLLKTSSSSTSEEGGEQQPPPRFPPFVECQKQSHLSNRSSTKGALNALVFNIKRGHFSKILSAGAFLVTWLCSAGSSAVEEVILLRAFQLHCCPLRPWTLHPASSVTTELTAIPPTVEAPLCKGRSSLWELHGSHLQLVK